MASSPRMFTQTLTRRRQTPELRRDAPLAVHRPSACSGVKALRNTSDAKAASRQATLAFRSLDPFRALREPDRRRRDEERPFQLRTKNCQHTQTTNNNHRSTAQRGGKAPLTGKAPYKSGANSSQSKVWPASPPPTPGLSLQGKQPSPALVQLRSLSGRTDKPRH